MIKFVFPKCALCSKKKVPVYEHSRVPVMVIRHIRSFMDSFRRHLCPTWYLGIELVRYLLKLPLRQDL